MNLASQSISMKYTKQIALAIGFLVLTSCAGTHRNKPAATPIAEQNPVNLGGIWERVPVSDSDKTVQYKLIQNNTSIKWLSIDGWPEADIPKNGVVLSGQLNGANFTGKFLTLSNMGPLSLASLKRLCGNHWKHESNIELTSNSNSDRLAGYVHLPQLDPLDCKATGKTTKTKIEFVLKRR